MRLRDDLRDLAASRGLRILLATRLISQTGDGMVQVGLVTLFFFAPQNATSTGDVAAALVVMLLPFSVVGPFTGSFIDRFRRRSTLMTMNLVRAGLILATAVVIRGAGAGVVVYLLVLAALGVNRFLLATLAASLPHVVDADRLLTANSLVPTLGGAATAAGAVTGLLLRLTLPADAQDVASLLTAAGLYVASAGVVSRLGRDELGPDWLTRARSTEGGAAGAAGAAGAGSNPTTPTTAGLARSTGGGAAGAAGAGTAGDGRRSEPEDTARGLGTTGTGTTGTVRDLADAVRHLLSRRTPALALGVMGAYRLVYGLELVTTILASRNLLADPADADAGLAVFGTLMGAMLAGHGLAVVLTPLAQERVSPPTWVVACMLGGSLGQVLLVAGHTRGGVGVWWPGCSSSGSGYRAPRSLWTRSSRRTPPTTTAAGPSPSTTSCSTPPSAWPPGWRSSSCPTSAGRVESRRPLWSRCGGWRRPTGGACGGSARRRGGTPGPTPEPECRQRARTAEPSTIVDAIGG